MQFVYGVEAKNNKKSVSWYYTFFEFTFKFKINLQFQLYFNILLCYNKITIKDKQVIENHYVHWNHIYTKCLIYACTKLIVFRE